MLLVCFEFQSLKSGEKNKDTKGTFWLQFTLAHFLKSIIYIFHSCSQYSKHDLTQGTLDPLVPRVPKKSAK